MVDEWGKEEQNKENQGQRKNKYKKYFIKIETKLYILDIPDIFSCRLCVSLAINP